MLEKESTEKTLGKGSAISKLKGLVERNLCRAFLIVSGKWDASQ
jgi:hypothetical protein